MCCDDRDCLEVMPEFKRAVFRAISFAHRHSWGLGGTAGIKRVVPHGIENEEGTPKIRLRSAWGVGITSMLSRIYFSFPEVRVVPVCHKRE